MTLSIVAVLLAAAILFPHRPVALPPRPTHTDRPRPQRSRQASAANADASTAAQIAALFVPFAPRKKTVPKPPPKPVPPIEPAWLHYLAFAVDGKGSTLYMFKDDRTGRVLILSASSTSEGWRMVSSSSSGFLLENGKIRYLVKEGLQ